MRLRKSIIIGTAGHIDHGKTALVKALTGVDTDRLPEEKARGITIDLGFAHRDMGDIEVSFIDVPGHERFVRNMLAGIGGIDLLMLVVAADESVMPQTREHFDICRLLGISAGLVVLTKTDLVDPETIALARHDVRMLVEGSFLEGAPVYEVSVRTGAGLEVLIAGLQQLLQRAEQRRAEGIFRLPVDRVFSLKGRGTVVTGTLIAGQLRKDAVVEVLPSRLKTRVRSIHAHDESVDVAFAGQRTAVNLTSLEKEQIRRGDVLTEPDLFEATSLLDVQLTLLSSARPLPHNALIRFHHHAADLLSRVTLPGRDVLEPGESSPAQLRLQHPIMALYGDHFILRRHSPSITVGGGIILDHMPARRFRKGDPSAADRLAKLAANEPAVRFGVAVADCGIRGATEKYLRSKLALDVPALRSLRSPDVLILNEQPLLCISPASEARIRKRILDTVQEFHQKNPLLPGISKEELRTRFLTSVPAEVFVACLGRCVQAKSLQIQKDLVALSGRSVALDSKDELLASRAEAVLVESRLEFPGLEGLSKSLESGVEPVKKILYLLVRQGKAVKISDEYFLSRTVWEDLKARVRELKNVQRAFSVPEFKEKFGVSRKYAIPLLEQLDRENITRRSGNERIIL